MITIRIISDVFNRERASDGGQALPPAVTRERSATQDQPSSDGVWTLQQRCYICRA
jgi:hypothetical protein